MAAIDELKTRVNSLEERVSKLNGYLTVAILLALASGLGGGAGVWLVWREAGVVQRKVDDAETQLARAKSNFSQAVDEASEKIRLAAQEKKGAIVQDLDAKIVEVVQNLDAKSTQAANNLDAKTADVAALVKKRLPPESATVLAAIPDCVVAGDANATCKACCGIEGWRCLRGLPPPPGVGGDRCDYDATGDYPCVCTK